ncbi:hypothetical protein YC2023_090327 [Brassica napus]
MEYSLINGKGNLTSVCATNGMGAIEVKYDGWSTIQITSNISTRKVRTNNYLGLLSWILLSFNDPTSRPSGHQKNILEIAEYFRDFKPDVNRTRNLLIWSQTRYHCATDPHAMIIGCDRRLAENLRSGERRGSLIKHEDPFNNHFLKVGKRSSTVEMRRKVYRLAPVTLTEKEQTVHQRRSSRAYQWKRTNGFPQRMRLTNHPYETTVSDIDQYLAQNNVYQKQGVPFRIRVEHEANTI